MLSSVYVRAVLRVFIRVLTVVRECVLVCMLCAVLHVSLWLGELLPGQQCINHGFYRVAVCDSLLSAPH